MITYQLRNGKTVRLTEDQYFGMSDQELADLECTSYGSIINDPFYNSVITEELPEDLYDDESLDDAVDLT